MLLFNLAFTTEVFRDAVQRSLEREYKNATIRDVYRGVGTDAHIYNVIVNEDREKWFRCHRPWRTQTLWCQLLDAREDVHFITT